nr:signal peptidase I [Brevibacterium daeguense]
MLAIALVLIVPGFFGIQRYVITGGSMSGSFEVGAVAFARPVPVEDLQVGDIITYQPPAEAGISQLVTHRISHIETDPDHGQIFTTKGDANAADDPWQFQIDSPTQPTVVHAIDYLGWPMIWLADRTWRTILIGAPAAAIFLIAAREFLAALRRPAPATAHPDRA